MMIIRTERQREAIEAELELYRESEDYYCCHWIMEPYASPSRWISWEGCVYHYNGSEASLVNQGIEISDEPIGIIEKIVIIP